MDGKVSQYLELDCFMKLNSYKLAMNVSPICDLILSKSVPVIFRVHLLGVGL